jgi:hypothetical protein
MTRQKIRQYSAAGRKFFTMLRLKSPNGFSAGQNCLLQPLHFGDFEGRVTRYCRIE